jgi:hypothetical protein
LRNLNNNKRVKEVTLLRKNATNEEINFNGAAYADDISVICKKALTAYSKFSTNMRDKKKRSGANPIKLILSY